MLITPGIYFGFLMLHDDLDLGSQVESRGPFVAPGRRRGLKWPLEGPRSPTV